MQHEFSINVREINSFSLFWHVLIVEVISLRHRQLLTVDLSITYNRCDTVSSNTFSIHCHLLLDSRLMMQRQRVDKKISRVLT